MDGHEALAALLFGDNGARKAAWLAQSNRAATDLPSATVAALSAAADSADRADRRLRTLVAFAREIGSPPLSLAKIAAATGRSIAWVRSAYGPDAAARAAAVFVDAARPAAGGLTVGVDWRGAPTTIRLVPHELARPNVLIASLDPHGAAGLAAAVIGQVPAALPPATPVKLLDATFDGNDQGPRVLGEAAAGFAARPHLLVAAVSASGPVEVFSRTVRAADPQGRPMWRWRIWAGPVGADSRFAATVLGIPGRILEMTGGWGEVPGQIMLADAAAGEGAPPVLATASAG